MEASARDGVLPPFAKDDFWIPLHREGAPFVCARAVLVLFLASAPRCANGALLRPVTNGQTLGVLGQSIKPLLSDDVSIKDGFTPWMATNSREGEERC